ncbi:MAG: GNAT family N-acetyltransferase [Anaerolineaceae bacterium]
MTIELKEVISHGDLREFIRFPLELYKNNPYYVPQLSGDEMNTLRRDKNAAFDHCPARYWMAYKNGRPAGRIAGILNRLHIQTWGQYYLRFGWVDFIDDAEVSAALFNRVESWAAELELKAVHGPLGFTDMDREAMLVEGFDEPGTLAAIYNYPYYPVHLERMGYVKDVDWVEYQIQVPTQKMEKLEAVSALVQKRCHLRLADVRNKKELVPYIPKIFDLLNTAYKELYGVVALTPKQIEQYVEQYFGFIHPDFVPLVVDEQDQLVAFAITMPSLTKALQKARGRLLPFGFIHLLSALKWNDLGDLYLVAVQPEYQGKGVNSILMSRLIDVFQKYGIRQAESNPELETNLLVQGQWKHFETRQHKRRRVYIKHLSAGVTK